MGLVTRAERTRGGRTRAGVESQDCLCLRRGWQTDMYLSTVRDTVIYTDITRLVCLSYTNHNGAQGFNHIYYVWFLVGDMNDIKPLTCASGKVTGTMCW